MIREQDYYGTHRDALHSYGGYAPNMPGIGYTSGAEPKHKFETSTTRRDYTPPSFLTGRETNSAGVFLGRSGFSAGRAVHNPTSQDVLRARLAQASDFYSLGSKMNSGCSIPNDLSTETNERFHPSSLRQESCGIGSNNWMHSPGSRETGFTSCYSSVNPVYWRQHDPLMDQLSRNPPELRLNACSVSQADYQPHDLVNGDSPIQGTIRTRGTSGTGFTVSKELCPCFLPQPCVYGKHDPSYLGEPSRFQTIYGSDYVHRNVTCDSSGREIIGRGHALMSEQSRDFSLGCGPTPSYLSESRERYIDHWPLDGQRNFGLSQPIGQISSSGFVHSTKRHAARSTACPRNGEGDFALGGTTDPQRYNPWPRFYLGHRTMVDKTYRPNPLTTGIDYAITTSLPTTSNEPEIHLY